MASTLKEFRSFANGVKIDDWTINYWIQQCLITIKSGAKYHAISSGDTSVIVMVWPSEIQVFVANSCGRSTLTFSTTEGHEDVIDFVPYSRPVENILNV